MDRRSPPQKRTDDHAFPVRLRVLVPERGFENLLPDNVKDHIRSFPLAAVLIGVGVGVFLRLKKSNEIIAAGTSLISAAAMANVGKVMQRQEDDEES